MRLGNVGDIVPMTLGPCLNCGDSDVVNLPSVAFATGTDASAPLPTLPALGPASIAQAIAQGASSTMPQATTSTLPSAVATANATLPTPAPLTPQSLQQRLPSIVNPTPRDASAPCAAGAIDNWVDQNKGLALLGLGIAAYLLMRK